MTEMTNFDVDRLTEELIRKMSLIYALPTTQHGAWWLRTVSQEEAQMSNPAVTYRVEMPQGTPTSIRLDSKGCVVLSEGDIKRLASAVVDEMERRHSESSSDDGAALAQVDKRLR